MKIAFVTNFCPHYRTKTFELLSNHYDIDFYLFSKGSEWYWLKEHGVCKGDFNSEYLNGFRLGSTRITPSLPAKLWNGRYDIYIKCINGRFALPATYLVARLRNKPFILWTGIWMRLQTSFHRLFFPATRHFYQQSDAIVVYGEHVKQYLISEGVAADKIFIAPHAVDNTTYSRIVSEAKKIELRQKLDIDDQKVILFVGRLEKIKGIFNLLDAFAEINRDDTVLVLVGTGSEQSNIERVIKERGLTGKVILTGYVSPQGLLPYYALSWLCVLPSVTEPTGREPWGLVINEAFNQGVPVVTTEAVGAAAGGLVQDGRNGFIVPERNRSALAKTMNHILYDAVLRKKMGRNALDRINCWTNKKMVQGFQQAVASVADKSKRITIK